MNYSTPTDPLTPCTECGGGTYTFASGSIWCPNEECQPGGRFIKRVAFERAPRTDMDLRDRLTPKRGPMALKPLRLTATSRVTEPKLKTVKPVDPFATGMDAFIGKGSR